MVCSLYAMTGLKANRESKSSKSAIGLPFLDSDRRRSAVELGGSCVLSFSRITVCMRSQRMRVGLS